MPNNETTLAVFGPSESTGVSGDIVVLSPEYEGFHTFYALLRRGTPQVIDAAEALLGNDPEIPDPRINPQNHFQQALRKYGVYGPIPEMAATLGRYHLANLRLIATSTPNTYSPGFKPPALKHFLGLNDPAEALLHCTGLLVEQAATSPPLRPAFQSFPIKELRQIQIPVCIPPHLSYRNVLNIAAQRFDRFMADHSRQILDWQETVGVIDSIDMWRLLTRGN